MASHAEPDCELVVVGAGPIGLFAAYYAGLRGLSTTVIESLAQPGGQVSALYPEKYIYDVAAHPAVSGRDLVDKLLAQLAPFPPRYLFGHTATALTPRTGAPGWVVGTDRGTTVSCGAVVVTAGVGTFAPRSLPCAQPFQGRGAIHHVPQPDDLRGRAVVVTGGGDSALDWALTLERTASSVALVHRSDRFRAHEHTVGKLRRSSVRVLTHAQVVACHGSHSLESVTVRTREDTLDLPARNLVLALGFVARPGPLAAMGLPLSGSRVVVGPDMGTGLDRVYAAGDVAVHPGKVTLIATGFGEAATAVNNAAAALRPELDADPGHSSDAPPPAAA